MPDDRSTPARIRDEAMRLFADHGPDAVSLRSVADAAGVSAPLIVHHFGSKAGLHEAVDDHVSEAIGGLIAPLLASTVTWNDFAGIAALFDGTVGTDPALLAYLRRMFVDGGTHATRLFADLHAVTVAALDSLQADGSLRPLPDPDRLAAFLVVNDLAALLLRDQIKAVTGADPFDDGLVGWSATVMDVYARGLAAPAVDGEATA